MKGILDFLFFFKNILSAKRLWIDKNGPAIYLHYSNIELIPVIWLFDISELMTLIVIFKEVHGGSLKIWAWPFFLKKANRAHFEFITYNTE